MRGPGLELDVERFRELAADGASIERLSEAATLFSGGFLEGFALRDSADFDDWQIAEAGALERELASVLQRLVERLVARGEYAQAIPHARRWLELDPLHESAHRAADPHLRLERRSRRQHSSSTAYAFGL